MTFRVLLALIVLLPACKSSSTTTSSSSTSGDPCDSFQDQNGLGTVAITVTNQRAERIVLPSPCCNPRPPQMEVSFGSTSNAPSFPPDSCACTCEASMDSMCGCSTDQQIYRLVDPGGSVTFDWAGTYYEQLTLTEQCAPSGGGGPCLAEKAVPAGEVTLTLHVLTNADVPDNPSCDDGVCITWDHSLGGQEETVPTTLTFNAAGAQTHTVTVD